MRLLATKGARRFTVALLAKEVGVTGGAIYRHFPSMDAVVDAVVEQMRLVLFDGVPPPAVDPIERLRLFFHGRVQALLANPSVARLMLSDELAHASGRGQTERIAGLKRQSRQLVLECLREAARTGRLARETTPEASAVVVLGSVLALAHAYAKVPSVREGEQLARQVWATIEAALVRGAPRGGARAGRPGASHRRGTP